jgi:hypothetical protein
MRSLKPPRDGRYHACCAAWVVHEGFAYELNLSVSVEYITIPYAFTLQNKYHNSFMIGSVCKSSLLELLPPDLDLPV